MDVEAPPFFPGTPFGSRPRWGDTAECQDGVAGLRR